MYLFILVPILMLTQACSTISTANIEKSQLRMQLGLSQLQRQNYALALKEFLAAEELNPKDPFIQNNLGLVYFLRERYSESIQHFQNACDLDDKYTDAKNNLARVYIEIRQFDKARKLIQTVLSDLTYHNSAKAYANLGLLEFNDQNYPAALKNFKQVLLTQREDCTSNVFLGRSYLELKQYKLSNDQLEKAAELCKQIKSDEGLYYYAISLYRSGEKKDAVLKLKELRSFYPQGKFHDQAKKMIDLIEKGNI